MASGKDMSILTGRSREGRRGGMGGSPCCGGTGGVYPVFL